MIYSIQTIVAFTAVSVKYVQLSYTLYRNLQTHVYSYTIPEGSCDFQGLSFSVVLSIRSGDRWSLLC